MKNKELMLPHGCQTIGWIIVAIPFILLGILLLSHLFCTESQLSHLGARYSWILVSTMYLCVPIGGTILCFSKEKEEDEMIKSIRLKAIGIIAIAELLICLVLFCSVGLNCVPGFFNLDSSPNDYVYLGHSIFCFQFPAYFILFKCLLFTNKKRNEE